MPDIPIKNEDDFSKDIVQAVDKIASEVASASSEFTKSFNGLTGSIQAMQNAIVNAIQGMKISITNNFKTSESKKAKSKEYSATTDIISSINENANQAGQAWSNLFNNIQKEINETDVSFAIDINEQIQKLADEFENELGPAIKSIDPYLLDARSTFQSLKDDLDEMASVASEAPQSIVELTDSLKDLMSQVDEERVMSKMGPKSLKDVFNIVSAGTQEIPEAIPLSPKGPQGLGDVFRIVAAATQEIPMAQRVFTKDEIRNPQPAFGQLNQASNPWQNLFSNISEDIKGKQEAEAQKQRDAEGLSAGMQFGPSRELFNQFTKTTQISKNLTETFIRLRNNLASFSPVFSKLFKGGIGGSLIESGIGMTGKGIGKITSGGSNNIISGLKTALAGSVIAAIGSSMNMFTKSVEIASSAIGSFSSVLAKSNPATLEQVTLVFNDLLGVIGRGLNPVVQAMIPVLRYFADYVDSVVKSLTSVTKELIPVYQELFISLIDLSKSIIDLIIPIFKMLLPVMVELLNILIPIVKLLTSLASVLGGLINAISGPISAVVSGTVGLLGKVVNGVTSTVSFIGGSLVAGFGKITSWVGNVVPGLKGFGEATIKAGAKIAGVAKGQKPDVGIQKGSSFGAAVRDVQSLSISGIGDELRKSALMGGANQVTQEQLLENINKKLEKNALADAFAEGIAKEKGKRIAPPPRGKDEQNVIATGEFDLSFQASV